MSMSDVNVEPTALIVQLHTVDSGLSDVAQVPEAKIESPGVCARSPTSDDSYQPRSTAGL